MNNNELLHKIEKLEQEMSELKNRKSGFRRYFGRAFQKTNVIAGIVITALIASAVLFAAQVTFNNGDIISANDVNANFKELYDNVGKIGQTVHAQTNSFSRGNTTIPFDDTLPQNTEGIEVITVTITPKSATSKLLIEAVVHVVEETNTANMAIIALFQDDIGDAVASSCVEMNGDMSSYGGMISSIPLKYIMTSNTSSPITFKVRAGLDSGYININGGGGSRKLGGSLYSSITVREIIQ